MARIVGVDIPNDKPVKFALTYIYGIGRHVAEEICKGEETADLDIQPLHVPHIRQLAAEEAQGRRDQRVPAILERLLEVIQDIVGGSPEFNVFEQFAVQEGDFEEAWLRLDDEFVFSVGEDFPSHFHASGACFEGDFRAVVDRLGEAGERQVPFHRVDAGYAG